MIRKYPRIASAPDTIKNLCEIDDVYDQIIFAAFKTEMIETFENDRSNRTQLILNPQPLKRGRIWEKLTAVLRIGAGKLNYGKVGKYAVNYIFICNPLPLERQVQ